jgi:hypothetical protein
MVLAGHGLSRKPIVPCIAPLDAEFGRGFFSMGVHFQYHVPRSSQRICPAPRIPLTVLVDVASWQPPPLGIGFPDFEWWYKSALAAHLREMR